VSLPSQGVIFDKKTSHFPKKLVLLFTHNHRKPEENNLCRLVPTHALKPNIRSLR